MLNQQISSPNFPRERKPIRIYSTYCFLLIVHSLPLNLVIIIRINRNLSSLTLYIIVLDPQSSSSIIPKMDVLCKVTRTY